MSLRSKVIVALRWSAGLRMVSQLASWAMTLIVVRLLSPSDYGLMSIATVVVAFLTMLNELGVGPALVQRKTIDDVILKQAFGITLISNLTLFSIVWFVSPVLAGFFGEPQLTLIIRVLSIQFFLIPFSVVSEARLLRELNFKRKSFVDLVSNLSGGATSLVLAINGYGVWSLVLGSLVLMVIRSLGFIAAAPYFAVPRFSLVGTRDLLSFGALITADRLLWFFYSRADVFIIGKLLGTEILGIYSVAMQIASLPMQKVNSIINEIAFPAFSKVQENSEQICKYLSLATRAVSIFAFPVFIGISSISPIFVDVVLGEQWAATALPLTTLACIMPLRMISNIVTSTLQGIGRVGISVGNLIYASIIIPTSILIGSQWGITGICIAWLVGFPLVFLVETTRSRPFIGISTIDFFRMFFLPLSGSVVMWFAVGAVTASMQARAFSVSGLTLLISSGAVTYLMFTLLFNRRSLTESIKLVKL